MSEAREQIRRLANAAAADLGIPVGEVNLLLLAHWLAQRTEARAHQVLR